MKPRIAIVVALIIAVVGLTFWWNNKSDNTTFQATTEPGQTTVTINGSKILAEIADSADEHATGLSYRDNLASGTGMLFIFDEPQIPSFWMREMKFPLDIIWISKDMKVVEITKNAPIPAKDTASQFLPTYSPPTEVLYVLEVNSGESNYINVGDEVIILNTNQL